MIGLVNNLKTISGYLYLKAETDILGHGSYPKIETKLYLQNYLVHFERVLYVDEEASQKLMTINTCLLEASATTNSYLFMSVLSTLSQP